MQWRVKGEGRKWLIALIKRDISHFRSCIKEVIIPSPLSPQFPHFPAFHSVSLSPFPLPLKNYNMIILKPRGPAGGRHLVGGSSELGPPYLIFHAQAVWPTRMTSTSMSISSLPFIYNTCIHDPNIQDTWHMYWWWMFILRIHDVVSPMYLW